MRARVLTISPALPFLATFAEALLAGDVVPGFAPANDPFALAGATIYVPTQRAARALAAAFLERSGASSILLPQILPLGALDATQTPLLFGEPEPGIPGLPLPDAASPVWRRLQLAVLIQQWARALRGAIRTVAADGTAITDDGEAFRVATSTADAFHLAGDLAGLIDELQIEAIEWRELDPLSLPEFDDYWRITTTFLSIAVKRWPDILAAHGKIDSAQRQIRLVEAQARALASGTGGPVIAIGSTGTNKATARLLAAISRAPRGAVVLPGLDPGLDEAAWTIVSGTVADDQEPAHGHPQAALARLLPILGITRDEVIPLGTPDPVRAARARLVAEALRPADTTDLWQDFRAAHKREALAAALGGVSLIDAADEREEALALAIALREVLETPDLTAALITPDRDLARRVRADLLRWNIEVLDTGGEPLGARPAGILARLCAEAAARFSAEALSALLAHPLASFGTERSAIAKTAALLEIGVFRAVPLSGKARVQIFAEARAAARDVHAHPAQQRITEGEWIAMDALWQQIEAALAPLRALTQSQPLDRWIAAHRLTLDAVAGLPGGEDAEALETLFQELEGPRAALDFTAGTYGPFFGALAAEVPLRTARKPHPRLEILGLLEARLIEADVMLLAGLDETVWPPQARTDPFLNRPMRRELGLTPPERRLGQTAHDFTQAMGAKTVILSRAAKRGGSPCVPSRFLLRLEALGAGVWAEVETRGTRYIALARALDRPAHTPAPVSRPRPKPPLALRPSRLSVTQIETLRRDPYAIYAQKILGLVPLPHVPGDLDASLFGSKAHEALHLFVAACPADGPVEERRILLHNLAKEIFAAAFADPVFAAFRWPALLKGLDVFLEFDTRQRATLKEALTECDGRLDIALGEGSFFTLTARADRIDRHRNGDVTLSDFKTGQPPGIAEVQTGFAPQLTLEAALLRRGAFGFAANGTVNAVYVKLGGRDGGFLRDLTFKTDTFDAVAERHFEGMVSLLASFRDEDTGYPARPYPKYAREGGDYDHLARVREWLVAGGEDPQ